MFEIIVFSVIRYMGMLFYRMDLKASLILETSAYGHTMKESEHSLRNNGCGCLISGPIGSGMLGNPLGSLIPIVLTTQQYNKIEFGRGGLQKIAETNRSRRLIYA